MARPRKSANVLSLEGRSHRTKRELAERRVAEREALTGKSLKETAEVKENAPAHKEFRRIKGLMKAIEKDDDLYGGPVNRYCMMLAECDQLKKDSNEILAQLEDLKAKYSDGQMEADAYYRMVDSFRRSRLTIDSKIQSKRKDMLAIEKECGWTVASSLRMTPKKEPTKKNLLMEALGG